MIFRVGESKFGAPAGVYLAHFRRVEPLKKSTYGPGIAWRFEIADGPFKGKIVDRITDPIPTLRNSCGKLIAALTGKALVTGQDIDVQPSVDHLYQITLEQKQSGNGTRIVGIKQPPPPPPVNRIREPVETTFRVGGNGQPAARGEDDIPF